MHRINIFLILIEVYKIAQINYTGEHNNIKAENYNSKSIAPSCGTSWWGILDTRCGIYWYMEVEEIFIAGHYCHLRLWQAPTLLVHRAHGITQMSWVILGYSFIFFKMIHTQIMLNQSALAIDKLLIYIYKSTARTSNQNQFLCFRLK